VTGFGPEMLKGQHPPQGVFLVIKTVTAAFALAMALSMIVPILVTDQPAKAGCERAYTSSGWVTRCK
jgi:hypothetical protein